MIITIILHIRTWCRAKTFRTSQSMVWQRAVSSMILESSMIYRSLTRWIRIIPSFIEFIECMNGACEHFAPPLRVLFRQPHEYCELWKRKGNVTFGADDFFRFLLRRFGRFEYYTINVYMKSLGCNISVHHLHVARHVCVCVWLWVGGRWISRDRETAELVECLSHLIFSSRCSCLRSLSSWGLLPAACHKKYEFVCDVMSALDSSHFCLHVCIFRSLFVWFSIRYTVMLVAASLTHVTVLRKFLVLFSSLYSVSRLSSRSK